MTPHPETSTPSLPRPVSEFLVAWAMALHRYAIYPPGHPSLLPMAERMLMHLAPALGPAPSLVVGVLPQQVVVGGAPSAESHAVLRDLAVRLHAQRLGAVAFRRGVDLATLTAFLELVSRDPVRGERPLGALPARDRPFWSKLNLLPLEYDGLAFTFTEEGSPGGSSLDLLWMALFRASLAGDQGEEGGGEGSGGEEAGELGLPDGFAPLSGGELPSANDMARALTDWLSFGGGSREDRARVALGALRELLVRLRWEGEARGVDLRARSSDLLRALPAEILEQLLQDGGDRGARSQLLRDAAWAGLSGEALILLVDRAFRVDGDPLSPALRSLLGKLSSRAEAPEASPGRSEARSVLRDQLRDMAGGRAEELALGGVSFQEEPLTAPTPMRVVELALQIDEPGPALEAALAASVLHGEVSAILDLAESASATSRTALRVERYLFSPERLRELLSGTDVDERSLRRIVDALGDEAIKPLFQALADSGSRAVRRKVFDRLVALGPRITDQALHYLNAETWYVQRNMLALLQRLPVLPPGFSPLQHLLSDDLRVRREALPLAFRDAGTRDRALEMALADPDDRVVRGALLELRGGVPDPVVPLLITRILEDEDRAHLRPLAARALGGSRRPEARDALLALCTEERGLLGRRRRLGPPTPEGVAALHALADGWATDASVAWVLEAARATDDPRFRVAAGGPATSATGSEG